MGRNMKKKRFNQKKFYRYVKTELSALAGVLAIIVLLYVLIVAADYTGKYVNNDSFISLNGFTWADYLLMATIVAFGIVPVIVLVRTFRRLRYDKALRQTDKTFGMPDVLSVLGITLWISSAASITYTLIYGATNSVKNVKAMVIGTQASLWGTVVLLIIGAIISLIMMRSRIAQNNWWAFATLLPYIAVGWFVQRYVISFQQFKAIKGFSYQSIYKMLIASHGKLNLMNEFQYTEIVMMLVTVITTIGLIIYAFIWKKTKNWRQKANQRKEEKAV